MRHSMRVCMAVLTIAMFVITASAEAQTFRGGISGRVVDDSGGVLPGVTITATNVGTGLVRTTVSSSTGVFTFPDLPLGSYTVEAAIEGFQPQRATVEVSVSKTSTADFKMGLSQLTEVVNVSAAAVTLDMQSTALANVIQPKQVQELPLNGRDFRGMLQLAPGVAGTSVNGVRTRGNNFQIDGADNNDAFQNTAAVNQGGVSGIAGTLLPIEAIDQFSVQSGGQAETGRNAGSTVNLVIKSGTNALHGSAYYFNRNENLAANSPVAAPGTPKRPIRNNQYRLLDRRSNQEEQGVLLHDPRNPETDRRQHHPDDGAFRCVGGERGPVDEPVWRAREPGGREPPGALAPGEPDRPGDRPELREHRQQHLRQRQRDRQGRSAVQREVRPVDAIFLRRRRPGRHHELAVPRLLPGGAEPHAQRVAGLHVRVDVAPRESAGGRLQLLQADVQLVRHLRQSDRDGLQHRRDRPGPGRPAQHHDQRVRRGGRDAAPGARRQDAALHQQPVVREGRASVQVRRRVPAGGPEHLLRQQQARHFHL